MIRSPVRTTKLLRLIALFSLLVPGQLLLIACGGEPSAPSQQAPPVGSAGADQDVNRGELVTLHGSATAPGSAALTYTWTQVSGPSVGALSGATPSFTAPNDVVTLAFDLVASDGLDQSPPDRVVVRVLEDKAHALWVAPGGDDANLGTLAAPKQTIQAAIDAANAGGLGADVYAAAGTYSGSLTLRPNVSVYGGYSPTTFLRDVAGNATVISGGTTAVTGTSTNALTLDGLTIRSADATVAGGSSVAILLDNSANVVVSRDAIIAGAGAGGAPGSPGLPGLPGVDGAPGTTAPSSCVDSLPGGVGGGGGGLGVAEEGGERRAGGRRGGGGRGGRGWGGGGGGWGGDHFHPDHQDLWWWWWRRWVRRAGRLRCRRWRRRWGLVRDRRREREHRRDDQR